MRRRPASSVRSRRWWPAEPRVGVLGRLDPFRQSPVPLAGPRSQWACAAKPGAAAAGSAVSERAQRRAEQRGTLRRAVPPWGVLLDHRHNGRLRNLSRGGLLVETRQAPKFLSRAVLKVCGDQQPSVQLKVLVVWCRLIGTEMVGEESAPRFAVGLECDNAEALVALGAIQEAP